MQIVYGLVRTGSHLVGRHLANKYNYTYLGEYFNGGNGFLPKSTPENKIKTLNNNCVIIVHPDIWNDSYSDKFYDWLFEHELHLTTTDDVERQFFSFALAVKANYWHNFGTSKELQNYTLERYWFDNFKRSYFKYYDSFHRIKIKKVWTLQDAHKIKDNGKYMLTQKTHNLTNGQIQNLFTNKEEILQWITELDIDKTA